MIMDMDELIQRIIDAVKEAENKHYSDFILKMDLKGLLENYIDQYNQDVLDDVEMSLEDNEYISPKSVLAHVRDYLL